MRSSGRPTVLLIAESVTLAHFARIVTLARSIDSSRYEVVVASDPRYLALEQSLPFAFHAISSIPCTKFAEALAGGKPLYDRATLQCYVDEDLALIDAVRPDLVVGDFRLSLAVSAPLRQVPYAAVVNAYWSPYVSTQYPVPDLPLTRVLGVWAGQTLFDLMRPVAFAMHAQPLNRVRRSRGLPSLGHDLRKAYSWGNFTLYPDIPELFPARELPPNHRFIGPVLWSTKTPLPVWWDALPVDRPVVLVTLGSSGDASLLPELLKTLGAMPLAVISATAGSIHPDGLPANVFVADYLPMDQAIQRADVLICNGGSLSTYQALASGVPLLGIATNMDQLLNMHAVTRHGAGICLRRAETREAGIAASVKALLDVPTYRDAARRLSTLVVRSDSSAHFGDFVRGATHAA